MTTTQSQPATCTLDAIDLAASGEHGLPWRTLRTATRRPRESYPGLPPGGLVTAAGYWFAEAEGRPGTDARRVDIAPPGRPGAVVNPLVGIAAPTTPDHRQFPRIALSAKAARALSPALSKGLSLEIGPDRAWVGVDAAAWSSLAPPILLTIALCWRLIEVTRRLDDLTERARDACECPGGSRSTAGPRRRKLIALAREMRLLVLDLPCFEGPLIDPRGYFPSPRSARLFRVLAKRLELGRWRALIDERVEIVEATLEALAEEERQRLALGCEVALEVLIILALVADIVINLAATLAGTS